MPGTMVAAVVASAVGANKWHLGLINTAGPRFAVEVVGVRVVSALAAVNAGTATTFTLKRVSGIGTGTAAAFRKLDKLVLDAPTGVTALSNLSAPTAEAAPELASVAVSTEEVQPGASASGLWPAAGCEEPVVLNNGDGIAVQQSALASAGAVDVYIYFRVVKKGR